METQALCKAIGIETAGYDPYISREYVEEMGCEYYEDYRELLKVCDFISIHVPLAEATKGMIGVKELSLMKKTALLINCSRGGIVDEKALAEALNTGRIAGAGTDVFAEEPPTTDHPLLHAKNLVYSPHSAAQTKEAVIRMADMCIRGCLAVLNGEKWQYVANPKVYEHPKWAER